MYVNTKINGLKRIILFLSVIIYTFCFLSVAYAGSETDISAVDKSSQDQEVLDFINQLSLEDKICQLFFLSPEDLTDSGNVTMAGDQTRKAIYETPVGGIIYMENNLEDWDQIKSMLDNTQQYSYARIGLPMFLAVDEEGGRVRRISGRIGDIAYVPSMREVGEWDSADVYVLGERIGHYLSELGFNVDFAPVADVLSNPNNGVIGDRSFGSNPIMVAEKVVYQSMEELMNQDLLPFAEGIAHGAKMIMMGHISLPEITGEMIPSSLSDTIVTDLLREKLKYNGIIITDALEMGAITEHYNSSDAAIKAIQAGCDMLLMPSDWNEARYALIEAVEDGTIPEERIDESVARIIQLKLELRQAHFDSMDDSMEGESALVTNSFEDDDNSMVDSDEEESDEVNDYEENYSDEDPDIFTDIAEDEWKVEEDYSEYNSGENKLVG